MKQYSTADRVFLELFRRAARDGEIAVPLATHMKATTFRARAYAIAKQARTDAQKTGGEIEMELAKVIADVMIQIEPLEGDPANTAVCVFRAKDTEETVAAAVKALGGMHTIGDPEKEAMNAGLAKSTKMLDELRGGPMTDALDKYGIGKR